MSVCKSKLLTLLRPPHTPAWYQYYLGLACTGPKAGKAQVDLKLKSLSLNEQWSAEVLTEISDPYPYPYPSHPTRF